MKKLVLAFTVLVLAVTIPSAPAQTFKVLHEFNGDFDGRFPQGALLRDTDGNLYGTTFFNGRQLGDGGTVFKIDSTGEETILFAFNVRVTGGFPDSPLIQDQAGNLYGIAIGGPGSGVVFKLSPEGEETLL